MIKTEKLVVMELQRSLSYLGDGPKVDGDLGPITREYMLAHHLNMSCGATLLSPVERTVRNMAYNVRLGGEKGTNNRGEFIDLIREATKLPGSGPWCAVHGSYAAMLHFRGLELSAGAERLLKNMIKAHPDPMVCDNPDDIPVGFYFLATKDRGTEAWQSHFFGGQRYDKDTFVCVGGNESGDMVRCTVKSLAQMRHKFERAIY